MHFFLIDLTSVSVCGPVGLLEMRTRHTCLARILVWCGFLFSTDVFLRAALAGDFGDPAASEESVVHHLAFGSWLLMFPLYWASITLSWRGFRTRIIYSYFQTNINKSSDAWTERREISKSTQPKERPGWEQGAIRSAPDTSQHQQLLELKLMFDIPVLLKLNTRV